MLKKPFVEQSVSPSTEKELAGIVCLISLVPNQRVKTPAMGQIINLIRYIKANTFMYLIRFIIKKKKSFATQI